MSNEEITLLSLKKEKKVLMTESEELRLKLSKARKRLYELQKEFIQICPHFFYVNWADNNTTNKKVKKFDSHCVVCGNEKIGTIDELCIPIYLYRYSSMGIETVNISEEKASQLFWNIYVSLVTKDEINDKDAFAYARFIMLYRYVNNNVDEYIESFAEEEKKTIKKYVSRYNK
jgi:hypothetical protein